MNLIERLTLFKSVIDNGGIRSAARTIGVNHATVIRAIQLLEKEFDCKLLEKDSGIQTTKAGEFLYGKAVDIIKTLGEARRVILSFPRDEALTFNIVTLPILIELNFYNWMSKLRANFPNMCFNIIGVYDYLDINPNTYDDGVFLGILPSKTNLMNQGDIYNNYCFNFGTNYSSSKKEHEDAEALKESMENEMSVFLFCKEDDLVKHNAQDVVQFIHNCFNNKVS